MLDVHLKGAFYVTQPAFRVMKENNYGRIVFAASGAGIFGNFGQSNYGAAKMGLVGLSNVLSVEGAKNNIKCNVIAPIAKTRLTEQLLGPMADALDPNFVTPLVAYLVSEECQLTHEIFDVGAGRYARIFVGMAPGWIAPKGRMPTIEDIREQHRHDPQPRGLHDPREHRRRDQGDGRSAQEAGLTGGIHMPIDPKKALGAQLGEGKYTWTKDQVILYHLGVGAGVPPTDRGELEYTYEKNLKVLPSYGVIPVFGALGGLGNTPGLSLQLRDAAARRAGHRDPPADPAGGDRHQRGSHRRDLRQGQGGAGGARGEDRRTRPASRSSPTASRCSCAARAASAATRARRPATRRRRARRTA